MGVTNHASVETTPIHDGSTILEQMVSRANMTAAYEKVKSNNGAPGIDNMTVDKLLPYLNKHWHHIKEQLLSGTYTPQAVRQVSIPKPTVANACLAYRLRWMYQNMSAGTITDILGSIKGGNGVFGSASMISDTVFVLKNQK